MTSESPQNWISDVEDDGRLQELLGSGSFAVGFFATILVVWGYALVSLEDYLASWVPGLLAAIGAVLLVLTAARWRARKILRRPRPLGTCAPTRTSPPTIDAPRGGTIICCSGGGIKSAAFCLGALQELTKPTSPGGSLYERARAIVAVSGGGYMAAAYADRSFRNKSLDPFGSGDEGGRELAALRRRTNYLVASGRVKFDLVSQLLFGLFINLLIAAAAASGILWLTLQVTELSHLIQTQGDECSVQWCLNSSPYHRSTVWLFWFPLLLIVVSFAYFLVTTYVPNKYDKANRKHGAWMSFVCRVAGGIRDRWSRWVRPIDGGSVNSWGRRVGRVSVRIRDKWEEFVDRVGEGTGDRWGKWFSNTPNTLFLLAMLMMLLYPGVPASAVWLHNFWISHTSDDLTGWAKALFVFLGSAWLGTFIASVRSAMKSVLPKSDSFWQHALAAFRKRVAPILGIAMIALAWYVGVVLAAIVFLAHGDWSLWLLIVGSGLGAILAWSGGYANMTSLFPFYRKRLQYAYLSGDFQSTKGHENHGTNDVTTLGKLHAARSERANNNKCKGPELVLCATANIRDGDLLPTGRNGSLFILSDDIGLVDQRLPGGAARVNANSYDPGFNMRAMDLCTAAAISGAAISPLAGREDGKIGAYRLLLALANVRLGVWVRNPHWRAAKTMPDEGGIQLTDVGKSWWDRVSLNLADRYNDASPFLVIQEAVGAPGINWPYLYLTDGGHYDNLGLVEALRRRPERIILLDGSGDSEDEFPAMGDAIATARIDHGIEIDFKPKSLMRGSGKYPPRAWCQAYAKYPHEVGGQTGPERCIIDYIKCVLPDGLSWDLESYKNRNPGFPSTSSKFEVYNEFDFEAFRKLGSSLVRAALAGSESVAESRST